MRSLFPLLGIVALFAALLVRPGIEPAASASDLARSELGPTDHSQFLPPQRIDDDDDEDDEEEDNDTT